MSNTTNDNWLEIDKKNVWHPYSSIGSDLPNYPVVSAEGVRIRLNDGRELIDGMSSWWCAIHGYNVTELNDAIKNQLDSMAHIMFGGLTHQPAADLTAKLLEITPEDLQSVFFSDSGSVAVEVAMKMAIQYWQAKNQTEKQKFISLRGGYHGDTFGAMSVCDPVTGMHSLFSESITEQFFIESPSCSFNQACEPADIQAMTECLEQNHHQVAAVILEPIVQGAGGMRFYSPDYLKQVRTLCDNNNVLLIADEIATGFGRTGKLFACEHADITPDIMCIGKSLTGGYMSMAATLTNKNISQTIRDNEPHVFMHGPTFMANPLACSVALASINLLLSSPWQDRIKTIETQLLSELAPCKNIETVKDVRVLGAIGVVEMKQAVDMKSIQQAFVDEGVWVRPFGKLVYLMPAYIVNTADLNKLTTAVCSVVESCS